MCYADEEASFVQMEVTEGKLVLYCIFNKIFNIIASH